MRHVHLKELFQQDPNRFQTYSMRNEQLLLDFSKQRITPETQSLLKTLADTCQLDTWKSRLLSGDAINTSENRPALHTALRQPQGSELLLDGHNIVDDVQANLAHMSDIVNRIHSGQWRGYSGLPIDTIVNIGVGGSDLGPHVVPSVI